MTDGAGRRLLLVSPGTHTLLRFRRDMLRAIAERGHRVLVAAPDDDPAIRDSLAAIGIGYVTIPLDRTGMNPLSDLKASVSLWHRMREFRPDIVMAYAPKPVIYGALTARMADVPRIAVMITGAGSAMTGRRGARQYVLAGLVRSLYRIALRGTDIVFFQNPDDERRFRDLKLIAPHTDVVQVNGSGVDLREYAFEPIPDPPVAFLMIARLLRDKGVGEYAEAAAIAARVRPGCRFGLLGDLDTNPTSISNDELQRWREEGSVEYLGVASDVRPHIRRAHVVVLPSYSEGTPRSVLEGMAMGRSIITTDVPGCRETVVPGRNGLLVPERNTRALAEAMIGLVDDHASLAGMGRQSRILAEERFDVHDVNRVIIEAIGL